MKRALAALLLIGCNGRQSPPVAVVADAKIVDASVHPPVDAPADAVVIDDTDVPQAPEQPRVFVPWEQPGAAKLWRGSRNVRMTLEGSRDWSFQRQPIAMDVVGGKASIYDGARNMTFDFAITAPCIATATEPFGKGGKNYHHMQFVVKNGVLHVGEGVVGFRRGKAAVVCADVGTARDVTIVDETGACTRWDTLGGWSQAKQLCAWSKDAGRDVLTIGTGDSAEVLTADGDVFMSADFVESEARFPKTKDFAEAKAAVTRELVMKDPILRAKAAGGVLGKTDTVASLVVTYLSHELRAKTVTVTGKLQMASQQWQDNATLFQFDVVDPNDTSGNVDILCESATRLPEGIAPGDTVVVRGLVPPDYDTPHLTKCSIAGSMPK